MVDWSLLGELPGEDRRRILSVAVRRRFTKLEVSETQGELADMAGTSRARVNRVLGLAEKVGAIELRRGRIHSIDRAPLDRHAR